MLLFCYYLFASDLAISRFPQTQSTDEWVAITDKKDDLLSLLPVTIAENISGLTSDLIKSSELEEFPQEQQKKFSVSSKSKGLTIPATQVEGIAKYKDILSSVFTRLAQAEKENNKEKFFVVLQQFLQEGHKEEDRNIPWTLKERVQFFTLFQFLSLHFKGSSDMPIGEKLGEIVDESFSLSLTQENLTEFKEALVSSNLKKAHVLVDNLANLLNEVKQEDASNLLGFQHLLLTIKENLSNENLKALWEVLNNFPPEVVRVEIKACPFNEFVYINKMITSQKIKSLDLSEARIKDEGTWPLARALQNNMTLMFLNLSKNYIEDQGAYALARALQRDSMLRQLILSYNQICSRGAGSLAQMLTFNTTLTLLDLSGNRARDAGAIELATALKDNKTLTSLNLRGNQIQAGIFHLANMLKVNAVLTSLNLESNQISDTGIIELGSALQTNNTLTFLNLSESKIDGDKISYLAEGIKINTTLLELNLGSNNIGDDGVKDLAKGLRVNKGLKSLNLSGANMGDEGVKALASAFQSHNVFEYNKTLERLDLSWNSITNEGIAIFFCALRTNPTLTVLNLKENGEIKEKDFMTLVEGLGEKLNIIR